MARLESVDRLNDLADAGLGGGVPDNGRHIRPAGLYDKTAERTKVIRNAREKLWKSLEED